MSERSERISRLLNSLESRTSYIKSKLGVLVPSQIRSLRLKSDMPRQSDLASEAGMHQSRISMFETPGSANLTLDTLSRLAAAFNVGLVVKFVPFSEMLSWENDFSQNAFEVTKLADDAEFLNPSETVIIRKRARRTRRHHRSRPGSEINQFSIGERSPYLREATEGTQMSLGFEERKIAKVITLPNTGMVSNVPKSMAVGEGKYHAFQG
jgi:transcriptional regulator with XRE-family HTH domain